MRFRTWRSLSPHFKNEPDARARASHSSNVQFSLARRASFSDATKHRVDFGQVLSDWPADDRDCRRRASSRLTLPEQVPTISLAGMVRRGERKVMPLSMRPDLKQVGRALLSVGFQGERRARVTRPPKVAFIAPREGSRMTKDVFPRLFRSLATRLSSRGAMKATFGGHIQSARPTGLFSRSKIGAAWNWN